MLNQQLYRKKTRVHQALKWLWLLITIIALVVILLLAWHYYHHKQTDDLKITAKEIRLNIDDFMYDLFREIIFLPLHKIDNTCPEDLLAEMQKISFDNPYISGLFLANNKQQMICSTVGHFETHSIKSNKQSVLLGPFYNTLINKPYFILQKKIGDAYIGIYLLKSVLENQLKPPSSYVGQVILYDLKNNKTLLVFDGHQKKSISPDKYSRMILDQKNQPHIATDKLQSIDDNLVLIQSNQGLVLKKLWFIELLFALLVILISFLFYLQIHRHLSHRFSLKGTLQYALKNKQFFPVYQGIYNTKATKYIGAEVLLRWRTDSGEIIHPDIYIDEAETSGLIVPITLFLIHQAFIKCKSFLHHHSYFHLGFNLSKHHFTDSKFSDDLLRLCEEHNINPKQILLELTERSLLNLNDEQINHKIRLLKTKGFSLAVDDYGTGHASISYLQHFPFNYLKIDKIYVQSIGSGAITETLTEAIIQMASKLELTIIAEGVETEKQLEYLTAHEVYLIQGWLFAKAMAIDQFMDLIQEKKSSEI
ncbi:EAL domain-containing protein [Legionella israelensis]|uniref:Rtn protein n=1 Tax=Legionella israelensis TaxID=454 RepID=A0A0W0VNR5_9GAMM|nr:EAL domain-containing protein [Legionella israelensis]KTD21462.1 Rtn protein [Legionella israelensis]QBS08458.1 EAL domain-containing protein [Legionella israelensis]SCY16053.1 sensor c-di-GMP phosphodiesterase, contains CSS-motif sensor and EAL domain [Legionella israelensis DSM 19235]STX58097.1 Rtn protein [Legionella israelensis]